MNDIETETQIKNAFDALFAILRFAQRRNATDFKRAMKSVLEETTA